MFHYLKQSFLQGKVKHFLQGAGFALAMILLCVAVIEAVEVFYGPETAFETAKAVYFMCMGFFFGNAIMASLEARKARKKLKQALKERAESLR